MQLICNPRITISIKNRKRPVRFAIRNFNQAKWKPEEPHKNEEKAQCTKCHKFQAINSYLLPVLAMGLQQAAKTGAEATAECHREREREKKE